MKPQQRGFIGIKIRTNWFNWIDTVCLYTTIRMVQRKTKEKHNHSFWEIQICKFEHVSSLYIGFLTSVSLNSPF